MASRVAHPGPIAGHEGSAWHSFAFRLGVAFAVVAIVGAGATALVVNAAFSARFERYLQQQQSSQVQHIGSGIARAYAGNGKWDRDALAALVPGVGSADVRVIGASGHDVWQWDGHSMRWNDRWMQEDRHHGTQWEGSRLAGGAQGGWGAGDHNSGTGNWSGSGTSSGWSSGWSQSSAAGSPGSLAVLNVEDSAPTPSSSSSTAPELGPVHRVPIVVNGRTVGTALVRLPRTTALPDAVAFRAEVIRLLLLGGALGALLSLLLGIFFARRATRPVHQVTGAARALASGDRTARLEADRSDEFGEMGRAFNSMADAVEDQERLRQSFAGEVAHELRTPLTILRTQVEGLRVGVLQPTSEALGSLDEEVCRMSRLVADLQILGSTDAAGFSLERAVVDVTQLVQEEIREFAGLFEGSEIRVETRLEPASAWVDRVRVGQVLTNLLSNALKFTPPGGLVRIDLRADGPWASIRVSDSGPGIPSDELPLVFDRFFRGRTARPSGSGIGLAVVRGLVEAQGGTVGVSSAAGNGSTFTVRLPRHPASFDNRFLTDPSRPLATVES